ncbi:autotransporter outer membrane beta-barrel domain-containing protein [Niveibacterium sp. SC-1]|uniref:autotransporter outer membrane beta-barrel domain-containing protein n=1 Tax=Niveibacterium sp. SC-1 TaxID=3135646 RepID=UPI00311DD468
MDQSSSRKESPHERMRRSLIMQAVGLALAGLAGPGVSEAEADTSVLVSGASGIDSSGTHSGETIKLGAPLTTGVDAGAAEDIHFDAGRVQNSAVTAANARGQTGLHAADGGRVSATGSSVVLEPKTGAGVIITANDLTGAIAEAGGTVCLKDSDVLVGGGAKGNNNRGLVASGAGSVIDMSGGSVTAASWGAAGILVEQGGSVELADGARVSTSGVRSATTGGSHGVHVSGDGSRFVGHDVSVSTTGASAYGLRVDNGASASLDQATVSTAGGNGHGVLAQGEHARVAISGGEIATSGKGSTGVWARDGAQVRLEGGTRVLTSGAALSAASPVDDEKTLSLSHGLLATGAGSLIEADTASLQIAAGSASAARAEDEARIVLSGGTVEVSGSATSTATTAALHALGGGRIEATGLDLLASGTNVGGARAEGAGSSVSLRDSTASVSGAGSIANPAAGARAMGGGQVVIEDGSLSVHGLTFGHGVVAEGVGSRAVVSNSSVSVDGNRSIGAYIVGGASGSMSNSSISVDAPVGAVGPWSPGVLVEGAGSTLTMTDVDVVTTPKTSAGVAARDGGSITLDNGRITTSGNYSTGLSGGASSATAGGSTIVARNVTIETHGNDNAMGVLADQGATVHIQGGSVITTGNGSPVASNLTFPHGLAARNPGALLVAEGTSVLTRGSQAYGAAVDDGGSMVLRGLVVKTEGEYSNGLYAGIGSAKPGNVSLVASDLSVATLGSHAAGALVSRQHKAETATLDLTNATISTQGAQSHGLHSESGAELNARNTVVSTTGAGSLGALVANSATLQLDVASVATTGAAGHGLATKYGGSVDANNVVVQVRGDQAAALYAQGAEDQPAVARVAGASLQNRDGATVAVAGVADLAFSNVVAGGSGQWLNVDRSVASGGVALPDMGTGQWQGIGQTSDSVGRASVDLSASVVTGSARTTSGSTADVTMRDTSIWRLTADSNLSALRNEGSLIEFSPPAGGQYKRLVVNNYQGANGTIVLNTYLFSDGSASDQLVVDGGQASGSSNLQIRNAGGPGAMTNGNGIQVVDAVNGATTEAGSFRLLSQVKAGPYEYRLHRGSLDDSNGEAWYLRSHTETPADPQDPGVTPESGTTEPGTTEPGTTATSPPHPIAHPVYRREVSLYSGIPALPLIYGRAIVDTLHERVGEERRYDPEPLPQETQDEGPSLAWGRAIYGAGDNAMGTLDSRYDLQAVQLGVDLYRREKPDGSHDQAGVSMQFGKAEADITHTDGGYAGKNLLRSQGIGGYWTHFWQQGAYLDGVLQVNRFEVEAQPLEIAGLETRGHGLTASLEAGYPALVDEERRVFVEPQAQLVYTNVRLSDTGDDAANVRFREASSLVGRLGLRVHRDWYRSDDGGPALRTNVWLRPSVWHEFKGRTGTEFSSAEGYVPFTVELGGTWGELNLGADRQLSKDTALTGSLGYQKSFGGGESYGYEAMVGVKLRF